MKGQWIGEYQNEVNGKLIINIEQVGNHFKGTAFRYTSDDTLNYVADFKTDNLNSEQETKASIFPVDPKTGYELKWEEVESHGKGTNSRSQYVNIKLKLQDGKLHFDSTSDANFTLTSILTRSSKKDASEIDCLQMYWHEFKSHISNTIESQCLFRGQKEQWKLRTSFHRRGRSQIYKFANEDVPQLHKRLSSITSHFFVLNDPVQNGAFLNLLQHHHYPTPLLDWSYSPYVAAFFAFREWPKNYDGKELSRIYLFDSDAWKKRCPQSVDLYPQSLDPYFSIMEFSSIDNPRMVPQQAVATLTNIDDIEAYILEREPDNNVKFLQAIDIPANQREEVMNDLRFMGITAGSLFPGIDGICEDLKERNFG